MAVQSKLPEVSNSSQQSKQTYSSGTLKLKPFDFKNLNQVSPSILKIAKKPTGKSWVVKDILYNNNQTFGNSEPTLKELENFMKIHFHL